MVTRKSQNLCTNPGTLSAVMLLIASLIIIAGCLAPFSQTNGSSVPAAALSVGIDAAPQKYSPVMSSTVGIGLVPNVTGFYPADAQFEWRASYGTFLDWKAPDYTVSNLGNPVVNHGEKVYWSFMDPPASTTDPVIVTLTARDSSTGKVIGSSRLALGWEGNFSVLVQKRPGDPKRPFFNREFRILP